MDAFFRNVTRLCAFWVCFTFCWTANAQSITLSDTLPAMPDSVFRATLLQLDKEAVAAAKKYRYKDALAKWEAYLILYKRDSLRQGGGSLDTLQKISLRMVECQKNLNLFTDALQILSGLYVRDTTNFQVMKEMADCYFLAGDLMECTGMYTKMLQQDSTNTYLVYQRALINIKGEWWENALADLKHLFRRGDSTNNVVLRLLGDSYYNTGDGNRALNMYDRAIQVRPLDKITIQKVSIIYLNLGMPERALGYTDAYRKLDSLNLDINQINGIARYVTRDFTGAETVLKKLVAAGDDTYNTNYYLGLTLEAQNRFDEAIPSFEVAYSYDTTHVEVVYHLGNACCNALAQEERGLQLLQQGLDEMKPKKEMLFKYHVAMSTGYSGLRKYDEADWHTMLAIEQNPRYIEGAYYRGVYCDYQKTKKKQAAEHYRTYYMHGKNKVFLANAETRFKALQEELFMEGIEIKPLEPRKEPKMAKDSTVAK